MSTDSRALLLGQPRFRDPGLAALAASSGSEAAWRQALNQGPEFAAMAAEGNFAVALRQADGSVFLAVDRFAQQTLCYRLDGNTLRFAQRADDLGADAELDPQAIFNYLYFHDIPAPRTVFSGVFRLPAGHFAVFDGRPGSPVKVAPYWVPSFEDDTRTEFEPSREAFLRLIREAVARELSSGPGACFLSGGTDSSTVAGMIGQVSGKPAITYSIGFEAEGYDEMAYARIAARHFGTDHREYYVTPDDVTRNVPLVAAHYDQPFGNSSALPAFCCARLARADGMTKLLAGDGGDELFGGNARYAKQRVFGWYDGVPGPLRRGLLEPILLKSRLGGLPGLKKGRSYVEQASAPLPDRLQMYNLLMRLGPAQVLTREFLANVDTEEPLRQQRETWALARTHNHLNRMLAFDWRYTLAESDLPKVCGTTALAGIDVGFPFLDTGLLNFSLSLPPAYKLKGLKLRWFFKEALRGFLPDEILTKKKQGFGLPFGPWTAKHDPLHRLATDSLRQLTDRGIVEGRFIERLLRELLPQHAGYYGELVWILMIMEQWLRQHRPNFRLGS